MIVLDDIREEDVYNNLDFYTDLFLKEKILGFDKFSLRSKNELGEQNFSEATKKLLMGLSGISDQNLLQIENGHQHSGRGNIDTSVSYEEKQKYFLSNIHADISPVFNPTLSQPFVIGMVMDVFSCGKENGKTFFLDREKMLEDTPEEIKEWMKQIHIISLVGQKNPSKVDGMDFDGTVWPLRSMPGITTHPITGIDNFSYASYDYKVFAKDTSLELEYRSFVDNYLNDESNWIAWEWEEGKAVLWDNLNILHTYSGGWLAGERIFSRLQAGWRIPFFKGLENEQHEKS